jgi:hypothetical protein
MRIRGNARQCQSGSGHQGLERKVHRRAQYKKVNPADSGRNIVRETLIYLKPLHSG